MKTSTIDVCPYARGYIPQELECAAAKDADASLPWYRWFWRLLRGDYFCEREGLLPCERLERLKGKLK